MSTIGVSTQIRTSKYLGLLSLIGRNKRVIFGFMKNRLWNHINHWTTKNLSETGKEILLKSCAQKISSYFMSVFLLLVTLQDEMQRITNSFWRGKQMAMQKKSTDSLGIVWLWERSMANLVSEISMVSTQTCYGSKVGSSLPTLVLQLQQYSKPNIFQMKIVRMLS